MKAHAFRPMAMTLGALVLVACDTLPPPPGFEGPAAPPRPPMVPSPQPTPSPTPARPAAPNLPGTVIEVEVSGKVVLPPGAPAGKIMVAITDGPCFQMGTHYFGVAQPGPSGSYLLDVFPPVGTQLEACAALVDPRRANASWWARADRGTLVVAGRGKTVYRDTDITLRRAPDVPLPAGLKPVE